MKEDSTIMDEKEETNSKVSSCEVGEKQIENNEGKQETKLKVLTFEVAEEQSEDEWDGSIDSSVIHGAINVSKNGLGAVSLFIAGGLYEGGLIFGFFILLMACILSATSFYIIAKCCHLTNSSSYTEIFKRAFGERYGWICSTIIGLFTTNILVLYILVLGLFSMSAFEQWHLLDWIPDDINSAGGKVPTWKNIFLITTISVVIAIPLSFLKELKYFKYTSSFGLFTLIYACFLHSIVCMIGLNNTPESGAITYGPKSFWDSITFFAVFIGAFNCHFNAANYYKSTGCNIKKFKLIILISFSFMFVINVVMGYCAFFNDPNKFDHSDAPSIVIFNGNANSAIKTAGLIGCLLIALNIAFGFGLVGFATRLSLNEFLRYLGNNFAFFSRFRCREDKRNSDDPSLDSRSTADVPANVANAREENDELDNVVEELREIQIVDLRDNESQTDDRHIPLTCAVIFIVIFLATVLILCSRGDPDTAVGACGLALNIAVAVFGTNVALTLPGFIYYKILRQIETYKISMQDWIIISSLIGVGAFASIAGLLKIFITKGLIKT